MIGEKDEMVQLFIALDDSPNGEMPSDVNEAPEQNCPCNKTLPNGKPLPTKILLVRFGKNKYIKGDEKGEFDVDDNSANEMINNFKEREYKIPVDWEHSTLSGDKAPAAAFIKELSFDPNGPQGAGIYGSIDGWTPDAQDNLSKGEYGSVSPVIRFNKETGKPNQIHSVALTNHPSLFKPVDLLAASDNPESRKAKLGSLIEGARTMRSFIPGVVSDLLELSKQIGETARGIPELEEQAVAFNDETIGSLSGMLSLADAAPVAQTPAADQNAQVAPEQQAPPATDIYSLIASNKNVMTPDAYKDWINQSLASNPAADVRNALESALKDISSPVNTAAQAPAPEQAPVAPVAPAPIPELATTDTASDILKQIGLPSDLPLSDIAEGIKMSKVAIMTGKNLIDKFGVKSFSDLPGKIDEVLKLKDDEILSLSDQISDVQCERDLDLAMSDGKITEHSRPQFKKQWKKIGHQDFLELMDTMPCVVPMADKETRSQLRSASLPAPKGPRVPTSDKEDKFMKMFFTDKELENPDTWALYDQNRQNLR